MLQRTFKGIAEDLGLTQKEMAERLDVSFDCYKSIESGKSVTPASVFIKVMEMAGITDYKELKIPREK